MLLEKWAHNVAYFHKSLDLCNRPYQTAQLQQLVAWVAFDSVQKLCALQFPLFHYKSPTLVQRFLVNITLAFLAKYTVGSKLPISSALICFALGLV